jgi:competence protein ComEC
LDPSLFQRRRPLFWLALGLCAGIAADAFAAPSLRTLGGLAVTLLLAVVALLVIRRDVFRGWRGLACGLAVSVCFGMLLHALNGRIPPADDISRQTSALPSFVYLRGTIVEASYSARRRGALWTLSVEAFGSGATSLSPASGRVRLRVQSSLAAVGEDLPETAASDPASGGFGEGDRVELRARVEAPPDVTLPESFDQAAHLAGQGIRRVGVVSVENIQRLGGPVWWRSDLRLRRFSATLCQCVETLLNPGGWPGSRPGGVPGSGERFAAQSALLNALLFGRREDLDSSDREAFAVSGTAHLLAISGLQIQFLAFLLWTLAKWLGIGRRSATWAVLLFSCGYCALAGADAPILRATVMIVFYLSADALSREADPLSVLAASALAILLAAPAQLFNAGFQLSFLAVLSLVTLHPALTDCLAAWKKSRQPGLLPAAREARPEPEQGFAAWLKFELRKKWGALPALILVSLATWAATAPVVLWHMGRFSTLGLLINIIAVPLSDFCMILGLLLLAASLLSAALAGFLSTLALLSLMFLQKLAAGFAALPFSALSLPPPAVPLLILYAALLAWMWVERRRSLSPARAAALLPLCLGALLAGGLFAEAPPAPGITVLDLNFGRGALIESPSGGAALLDAGGLGQGERIAEVLRHRGIERLSLLVISADEPEAIDGALALVRRVPAARVVLPRAASASRARRELERHLADSGIPYGAPVESEALLGPGETRWEFCGDGGGGEKPSAQETALNVRVSLAGTRVLFVNARSSSAMQRFLARGSGDFLQADILRLTAGGGRWPPEVGQLMRQSNCRVVIAGAGSDPRETPGADLAALADAHNLRLFSTHDKGSIRVQADTGSGRGRLQSFRNGIWKNE